MDEQAPPPLSIAAIDDLPPRLQVKEFGGALEAVLRPIPLPKNWILKEPSREPGLGTLLDAHKRRLKRGKAIRSCVWVRDDVVHNLGESVESEWVMVAQEFRRGLLQILQWREVNLSVKKFFLAGLPPEQPSRENERTEKQEPLPFLQPPEESSSPSSSSSGVMPEREAVPPPSSPPASPVHAKSPPSRFVRASYIFAGAFFLLAAFAYLALPRRAQLQQPVTVAPPPPPHEPIKTLSRADQFRSLINANLSISSTEPNIALIIMPSGAEPANSVSDVLGGFLADAKFHFIVNLADLNVLKAGGFFDDMYDGNGQFLGQAAQLSRVDYILLGKASYSFRRQSEIDSDLITCDLTLACRLVDHSGTVVQSATFTAAGPGFSQAQALERAAENLAKELKEKMLDPIR